MYTYVCEYFVFFRNLLFVRALFGKTLSNPTREAWPETLTAVSARSVPSGARGGSSFFLFFPAGVGKTISLVLLREALFSA